MPDLKIVALSVQTMAFSNFMLPVVKYPAIFDCT